MKTKIHLGLYTIVLLIIFLMAYLRYIPTEIFFFPFFDSLGHFVLYGFWGYFFARAFSTTIAFIGRIEIQRGILLVIPIAIIEESLQSLSAFRTFSFFDMAWGVFGIFVACLVMNYRKSLVKRDPR